MPRRFAAAIALSSLVLVAACQKDSGSSAVAQSGTPDGPGFDPATRVATVIATDFAFTGPDSISAGWTTFHLKNQGTVFHHLVLVRLDSGKTPADLAEAMKTPGPPPAWAVGVGGPNVPDPGAESNAVLDLQPGQYVMLCFVDVPDHVPHVAKGMVHPLVVTASAGPAGTEPTADATITMADYSFDIQGTLNAGKHTIRVLNDGPQEHEVAVIRFAPGKTMQDVAAWAAKMDTPFPGTVLGGAVGLSKGVTANYFDIDLTPGSYALLCFVADAKDQQPHIAHGMVKEFTVE